MRMQRERALTCVTIKRQTQAHDCVSRRAKRECENVIKHLALHCGDCIIKRPHLRVSAEGTHMTYICIVRTQIQRSVKLATGNATLQRIRKRRRFLWGEGGLHNLFLYSILYSATIFAMRLFRTLLKFNDFVVIIQCSICSIGSTGSICVAMKNEKIL